ncbi:MAG: DUF5107 domain-containing protein [Kiritimatiellae bacterium]|nr:DUF5107 domain-containing protein [Kiritimatiellia bacterium]
MKNTPIFREDSIVLPTYAPGGYDKTPIFYTGRVYQGAQGRVYPYPMQDVLHDGRADETYKYLTLENKWFHLGLLPEHGGHLLNFTDKQTGYETFYRQHVVKPALIGMLGAWISGGVEWNFPHHHRATTAMPIDWRTTTAPDGTPTVWIGETELRRRLKWTIGLSLLPDRAVLRARNIFMNRGPWIESMIYWANVSVHCGDDYQILFPPSMHLGFDHHKNYWTHYPIGPRKEELELLPSQRSKYANDIEGDMDLSWWRNFTIESRSIFGMDPDNAFMAGYDHGRQCGTVHVSNRHITVGKKFFLWGNFPEAHVWDKVLTDNDGPYLELMVGCWSDNQPDYSWIAPYETRKVEQFWFPVKGIGGVKNVTVDGAVNVDRQKDGSLLVGFHSTRELEGCTVRLFRDRDCVFEEQGVSIGPDNPWREIIPADTETADQRYTAAIFDASGHEFLSYTPVGPDPRDPLPPKVANPKPPKEYTSAELAYETGLRLDQFHNGLVDPVPYYERALEIDPDYTRANLAMGVRLAKEGSFVAAKPYLERAVARATQNHTRALDAAPEYYLALVERHLGNLKRAEDLFWRCTWRLTHKKESFVELARIASLRGDFAEALVRIDDALALGQDEAKLWTMKGIFLRRAGNGADECFDRALACDPLEVWAIAERDGAAAALANRGIKAQQLLEAVSDYWGVGLWDDVIRLCDAALAGAASEKPFRTGPEALPLSETIAACDSLRNALFGVFKGAALAKKGDIPAALAAWRDAEAMPTDYVFPNRLEEEEALRIALATPASASAQCAAASASVQCGGGNSAVLPAFPNLHYYLGCCEWNHDRKDAALEDWRKCVALAPRHALALRCIAFGLSHPGTYFTNTGVPSGIASREAYDVYLRALEADPLNFRTLDEASKLAEKLDIPAAERVALLEKYRAAAESYDPCMLRLAYALNAVGRFAEAHAILTGRRFHVWEGADGLLAPFVDACLGLGTEAMGRGDFAKALAFFEESTTYPENLQAGRPGDAGTEPKSRYFMAQCRKALGDEAGCRAELENALKGWIHAGEMDYWRAKALRQLGRDSECAPLLAELRQAIAELETPAPEVINAYAKFAGDNSAMERAAKARSKAGELRRLLAELQS